MHGGSFLKKYGTNTSVTNVRRCLNEDRMEALNRDLGVERRRDEKFAKNPNAKRPKNPIKKIDAEKRIKTIKRNRLPTKRKIRVSARHFLWQMEYLLTGYKADCSIIDPTTIYAELPYYGWTLDETGKCKVAERVSIKRPDLESIKTTQVKRGRCIALGALSSLGL